MSNAIGCTALAKAATVGGEETYDEYGSGLLLCWADVTFAPDGSIVCGRGHDLRDMAEGALAAERPNAQMLVQAAKDRGLL